MTFVPKRLALAFAIAHGQAGSHRFAGRISNDKRACVDWSRQLPAGGQNCREILGS
jgi:hypothetical protein